MIVRAVAKLENGFLDLAALVPNAGGYEPDPIKRIHNSYCEIRAPLRFNLDIENFFKGVPQEFEFTRAAVTGYGSAYREF
jgi:hypothetical protein